MKFWQCTVCKYIHKGDTPPDKCPICGVGPNKFVEIDEASIPEKKIPKKKTIITEPNLGDSAPDPVSGTGTPGEKGFEKILSFLIRHHAHPVSVHTPNGILPMAVVLLLIAWVSGYDLLAKTAFISLIFVFIALPFVIFTGVLEWKRKYNGAMTLTFKLKILAAALTTTSCAISIAWYIADPEILSSPKAWVFILINIIMLAAAGVAGSIGGKLVFKD